MRHHQISAAVRQHLKVRRAPLQPSKPRRILAVEGLEDRTLLTTTVFLDFGDRFPVGGLTMNVRELRDTFAAGGIQGPDLRTYGSPAMTDATGLRFTAFNPLVTFDYDGNGRVDAADATSLRTAVLQLVFRYYLPFDVYVREGSAASLADIRNTLTANNGDTTGRWDAYVFVAGATRTDTGRRIGQETGANGVAPGSDACATNRRDDTALTYADVILAIFSNTDADTALARIAAHEAGHTFRLGHTGTLTPGDADMLTNSDLMTLDATPAAGIQRRNFGFFTRFPVVSAPAGDGGCGGTPNSFNLLRDDPDIGLDSGRPAYVTGTGAHDHILLTYRNATTVEVSVLAYGDAARTRFIGSTAYTVDPTEGILVDAGYNNDRIEIDARIGRHVDVYGMAGTDELVVNANGAGSDVSYTADLTAPRGLDGLLSYAGSLTAGPTSIRFREFEPTSALTIQGFPNATVNTLGTADNLTISSPAATQYRITGSMGPTAFVPVNVLSGTLRLTVNAGSGDLPTTPDTITITGTVTSGSLTVNTGRGNDTFYLQGKATGSTVTLNGGEDNDTFYLGSTANTLSPLRGSLISIDGGTGTSDAVQVNDQGDSSPDVYYLNRLIGFNILKAEMDDFSLSYANLDSMVVNMGSGADLARVWETRTPVTLNGNGGGDTFNVGSATTDLAGIQTPLTLNGQGDTDVVNLTDQAATALQNYTIAAGYVQRGTLRVNYSDVGALLLTATNYNDSVTLTGSPTNTAVVLFGGGTGTNSLTGPNAVTDWELTGANMGVVVSTALLGPVTFVGFQNLTGGTEEDRFTFFSPNAAVAGTINGGLGAPNGLDYSPLGTAVTVNLPLRSATNVGSGAAGRISYIQNATGGRSTDILVGDKFSNVLDGGPGRDLLIAGGIDWTTFEYSFAADFLLGGGGEDILIAGFTDYDTDPAALNAIRVAWTSGTDYWTRANNIYYGMFGSGTVALNEWTVHYNYAVGGNVLLGGDPEPDWFFGNADPAYWDPDVTDGDPYTEWFIQIY